jgi:hypothetical protein
VFPQLLYRTKPTNEKKWEEENPTYQTPNTLNLHKLLFGEPTFPPKFCLVPTFQKLINNFDV